MELEYQKQQQEKLNENKDFISDYEDFISDEEYFEELGELEEFNQDFYDEYDTKNYQNSCIYRIYCKNLNIKDEYNGSTDDFDRREQRHKNRSNNNTNSLNPSFHSPVYIFIRKHGGWNNWIMEKLYDYPCNTEDELTDEEDRYVRNNPYATLQGKKVKLTAEEKKNYGKIRYQAMTPEEREIFLANQRERRRIAKENETEEEQAIRLQEAREKYANMNDEDKREFLDKQSKYKKNKLKNETVVEKNVRLEDRREKYANMDADKKKERQKKEAVAKKTD